MYIHLYLYYIVPVVYLWIDRAAAIYLIQSARREYIIFKRFLRASLELPYPAAPTPARHGPSSSHHRHHPHRLPHQTRIRIYTCSFKNNIQQLLKTRVFLFLPQMSRGLDRSQMRPVSNISGLCERLLPKTMAVSVQRRMGWYVLQPGPELLHQPRALQKWRNVLQHWPGPVHVLVRPRIYGT